MKKKLFFVLLVCLTGILSAQTVNEALFFVLTDVSTRLDAKETYPILWENRENGRFFIATVTGQDQDGKNIYGRNVYIINQHPSGRNQKYPMFVVRDAVTTRSIIDSVEECGVIMLRASLLEQSGLQIRITGLAFTNSNALARYNRIVQSMPQM
jgi:hypothetical protein